MTNLRVPSTRHDGCRRWTAHGELFPGAHRASCVQFPIHGQGCFGDGRINPYDLYEPVLY